MRTNNILIITVGESPAVVTETVWALFNRKKNGRADPFIPAKIHLVTTDHGRRSFSAQLIGAGKKLEALFLAFGYRPAPVEINLPLDAMGKEMSDIRSEDENVAFANTVSRLIRLYTDNPATRVHVSLAGGRKTMSYFAGAAISLFGRDQDELSHVLVTPEALEKCDSFWWPGQPEESVAHKRDKATRYSTKPSDANVELALIPFVRLKHIVTEDAFPGGAVDYAEVVRAAQESLDAERVVLACDERKLSFGRNSITLPHREFALYRLLATATREGWPGAGPDGLGNQHKGWVSYSGLLRPQAQALDRFYTYYEESFHTGTREYQEFREFVDSKLSAGLIDEVRRLFTQTLSKLNKTLKDAVTNPAIRQRLKVVSRGRDPARFGLLIEPQQIEIQ